MQTALDIIALFVFLLVFLSVVVGVRGGQSDVSLALTAFVALFVVLMGLVFLSAASQLATGASSTQIVLLVFFIVIGLFARMAWASKSAA